MQADQWLILSLSITSWFLLSNILLIIYNVFYSPSLMLLYDVLIAWHCCASVPDNSYRPLSSSETLKVTPQCHILISHCLSHVYKEHFWTLLSICQTVAHSYILLWSSLIMPASSTVTISFHKFRIKKVLENFETIILVYVVHEYYKRERPSAAPTD